MQRQINNYITNHLSPHLCGYRKGYNTHQNVVSTTEWRQKILDEKGFGGAILMGLPKAFDTLNLLKKSSLKICVGSSTFNIYLNNLFYLAEPTVSL